uniref:DUF834 domain-containing protein n=1 Tax=Oryza glumipatula TaxID=40148 RepID=A0A0D9Z5A0_9ORYZ
MGHGCGDEREVGGLLGGCRLSVRTFGTGWGRGPAWREEDAVAGDEPRAMSSRDVEDLVYVASRPREPAARDISTKRGGASVAGARERSDVGGRS